MAVHENRIMNRVMIACVTNEVNMVVQPVRDYRIDRIHLINYVKPTDKVDSQKKKRSDFYQTVSNAVLDELHNLDQDVEIIQHTDSPPYKFELMMKEVYHIIDEEQKLDSKIYVNITSGTGEYSAAASIASMMHRGVQLFSVGGKPGSTTADDYEKMIENISKDGRIVGSYTDYYEPMPVEGFPLDPPQMNLVNSLKVFSMVPIMERSNSNVIRNLVFNGLWMTAAFAEGDPKRFLSGTSVGLEDPVTHRCRVGENLEYTKLQRKEAVQYQRNFIDKWLDKGWIYKDRIQTGNKYDLTAAGRMYLDVFCSDKFSENQYKIVPAVKR